MRLFPRLLMAVGGTLLPTVPALAADAPAAATCSSVQHRQFDFWLGRWEVRNPAGTVAGHSRIESILGGCVVLENWDGARGISGKSFNLYNADTEQWEQFWVDSSGSRLHLRGGLRDGAMVLEGIQDKPDPRTGLKQRERITWTPKTDGSVRQLWETSTDDGHSWTTSFDGRYRRADQGK